MLMGFVSKRVQLLEEREEERNEDWRAFMSASVIKIRASVGLKVCVGCKEVYVCTVRVYLP